MSFVVCIEKAPFGDFSTEDLTLGRLYEVVEAADLHGMVRIVDDSGEDYLLSHQIFCACSDIGRDRGTAPPGVGGSVSA